MTLAVGFALLAACGGDGAGQTAADTGGDAGADVVSDAVGDPGDETSSDIPTGDMDPTLDSDGDGLTDLEELTVYGTSPDLADTDGDGFNDGQEVHELGFDPERNPLRFNPRISDIPTIDIEVTGPPEVTVVCTEGTERTRSFTTDRSTEQSTTITNSESGSSSQTLEFGVTIGSEAGLANIGLNYAVNASESNTTMVGWSEEQSQTNSTTFSASRTYAETNNETCTGGEILSTVRITNTGDIAFTLKNLVLGASYNDRGDPWTRIPVGNLFIDTAGTAFEQFPVTTLGPGDSISQLAFRNNILPLAAVRAMLRDNTNLIVEPVSRELTDANDQSFVHSATTIQATTATLILDFGLFESQERYHVATNLREGDFGVTAGQVLEDYLGLVPDDPQGYSVGTVPWDYDGDNTPEGETFEGLVQLRGVTDDSGSNSYWVVAYTVDDGRTRTTTFYNPLEADFDLAGLELRAGDVLHLAYIQDVDGDGLAGRSEFLYGTDPGDPDTDGDGLTDGEEIRGWDISIRGAQVRVYSNPLVADTDGDGDDDATERDNGTHPSARGEPNVFGFEVEGVDFSVTVSALVEDADGVVETITVDWGDETTPHTETGAELTGVTEVEHTYAEPGLYTITITAVDDDGNENLEPAQRDVPVPIGMLAFYAFNNNELDSGPFEEDANFYLGDYAEDRFGNADSAGDPVASGGTLVSIDGVGSLTRSVLVSPHLDFSTEFTLAGWVMFFNTENKRILGQANWFSIYIDDLHLALGELEERTPTGPRARDPNEFPEASWKFVAGVATYDGAESTLILYVDGQEVDRTAVEDTRFENPGQCNFYVGSMYSTIRGDPLGFMGEPIDPGSECEAPYAIDLFPGFFDDVRVYDRALTATEIEALYNETSE